MTSERELAFEASAREAFLAWVDEHAYIWFDNDLRLARALAQHFGIVLEIDGLAVTAEDVPGVTKA